jgi:hypothetical protein
MLHPILLCTQSIYCFSQHNNYLRVIQMNVYIEVINLKGTTCFDHYGVIIRCRLVLMC